MVSSAAISCMYQAAGRDNVARARRDLSVRGPRIWWIEKADKQRFIVVFPQALPVDPARPSGASPPNILIQHWTFTINDSVWWTHKIAANYPYLANPGYPRIIHPLDAPFLAAVLHGVLKKYRADTRRCRSDLLLEVRGGNQAASSKDRAPFADIVKVGDSKHVSVR